MGTGYWGNGYGPYDRPRGNYSDCPKLKDVTPAGYRVFGTAVERWSLTTAHTMTNNAFEVINALPTEIAALFASTPNSMLMTAGGVYYVMSQVRIQLGVRPGDEIKEMMDRVYCEEKLLPCLSLFSLKGLSC